MTTPTAVPSFVSIRIITEQVDALVAFYERATGVIASRATEDFAELDTPAGRVAIAHPRTLANLPGAATGAHNSSVLVEFLVDDVDEVRARLTDRDAERVVLPPTTMPWGTRSLLVHDPDGTLVNFFAPVTPEAIAKFRG
jgi:predicted enzyme related to lactoylglutathione lyase